ncbi:PAS domain-containing sensor histidine kinase [Rhodohalobacter mucosus]|uniref:histidine kinase n=1 Tax=Rhodohalobacter mucosus TaxID=2079485 RepID=A0A316TXW1_9BACT|nr:PAS domain S-box protein [Rhodohalobacter mucosus]PWN07534.1 PAS domain S-box protein [Rhodohalobacter mucosus]
MSNKLTKEKDKSGFFESEAMFIYDHYTYRIIDVNDAAVRKYGYSTNEFRSMKVTDLGDKAEFKTLNTGDSAVQPASVWIHHSKKGDRFYIQFTRQHIKYHGDLVQLAVAHDISDKVDTLGTNLHTLPRVDTMKAQLPVATIEWDKDANVRDWSDAATRIFGWSFSEIIGKNLFEIGMLPSKLKDKAEENIGKFIEKKSTYFSIDSEQRTKSGDKLFCTWHNAAIYDQSGKLLSIYSLVEDITAKKEAELKLKESEERFRVLSDASLVGIYMLQDFNFRYVNPRLCEMSGYREEELVEDISPFDLIHRDDQDKLSKLREMWQNSEIDSFEIDLRAVTKRQKTIHVKVYGSKIMMKDKPALIGVVVDQTKQIEATEKYKTSVESYRALFDSIGDAIYIQDRDGKFIEVNKTALDMNGYSRNEIIGKDPIMLAAPGKVDLEYSQQLFEKALSGEKQEFEWWGKRKNGEVFPKNVRLSPGNYFGEKAVITISRDISDQYEQQKELRHNEELFRQLFQNAPIGIALLDDHKEIQMANHGFEEIFGYKFEDIKGLAIDSVIAPDDKYEEAQSLSESKEPFETTSVRRKRDGSLIDVLIYGVPVLLEGRTIAIYGIYVDITDRKKAERQIRQSLEEKEVLLSEIHHRVKNNLAVITGLLELQSHRTANEIASKALKDSQMRINSMALIHEKLYQSETLSNIEFDHYVKELIEVIMKTHALKAEDVDVQFDTDPIQFAITQAIPCGLLLNEIVTNVFKHAFPDTFKGDPKISIALKNIGDNRVELNVRDNGVGLPADFDTLGKKSLGITLIKTLSKQIEAEVDVDTQNGTGFRFRFDIEPQQS